MAKHALALADWLQDFAEPSPRLVPVERGPAPVLVGPGPPEPDLAAIIAQAVADAEAALKTRLWAEHAMAIEAAEARHAAAIDRLLSELGAQAGQTIATAMEGMEARVVALTSASAARILGAVAGEDLARRSTAGLARTIGDALADAGAARIRVRGPRALFEALQTALGLRAAQLDFVEASGFDLAVHLDGAILETRLSEWSAVLAETLA